MPGTHKFERLEPVKLGIASENITSKMRERGCDVPEPVIMDMAAGGDTLHHGRTFHYAGPNQTTTPRRILAIIYVPDSLLSQICTTPAVAPTR